MRLYTRTRHHASNFEFRFIAIEALVVLASYIIQGAHAQNYDYTGGVALRYPNDTCPYNTEYIGTSFYPNCCPSWTKGAPSGSGYCCPSNADCYVTVARAPKCADQSWVYCYDPESDAKIGFCCLEGWQCIVEKDSSGNSLGVGCDPPNERIASTQSQASTSLTAYEIPGATSSSAVAKTTSSEVTKATATTSAPTPANTDSLTGLSTGAKAGIGVGAAIAGLALIGVIVWLLLLFRKRGDRARSSAGDPYPQSPPGYGAAKVAPTSVGEMSSGYHDPRELDSNAVVQRSELEGDPAAHEMGNNLKWR